MMKMKRFAALVCLVCLSCLFVCPALGEDSQDVLVIPKFKKLADLVEKIGDSPCSVIDISAVSASPADLRAIMAAYPAKTFRYRIRALNRHILWDTQELDLQYAKYTELESLTELLDLLPNVTKVTTFGRVFTAEELDDLYARYPRVTFFLCKMKMANHVIRTDITAFCTKHAKYTKDRHNQDDFVAFRHCPYLVALDVGHNAVTDLSFLEKLPKLQILILTDNRFSDCSPLACQTELEYLELFLNDSITDISVLSNCPKLIDLHIGWCNISDITPLYGLTKLDRLWLAKNPIPQEQIDHIRGLLPDCTVNDTAVIKPTAEGWRQGHPRYLKIAKMFGENRYVPFP